MICKRLDEVGQEGIGVGNTVEGGVGGPNKPFGNSTAEKYTKDSVLASIGVIFVEGHEDESVLPQSVSRAISRNGSRL